VGVAASYDELVNIFGRIQSFLQRLKLYTGVLLTPELIEVLGKITAEIIHILALTTKEVRTRSMSEQIRTFFLIAHGSLEHTEKFVKRLAGKTPIEDALQKLNNLTQDEALMVAANNLEIADDTNKKADVIKEGARNVFDSSGTEG